MAAPDIAHKRRLVFLLAFIILLFLVLLGRLFYVQMIWGPDLQNKALLQWTMDSILSPDRGKIMDRDGQVLAQSGTAYKIEVNPQQITSEDLARTAKELSDILELDYNTVLMRISNKEMQQVILKRQVEREKVDALIACKLKGVTFGIDAKRYYPMGSLLSQTLGFTTVDGVGQEGLERAFNKYLAGEQGRLIVEKDATNKPIPYGTQEYIDPVNGYSLVLTIDSPIQAFLEKALEEARTVNEAKSAMGLVMDVETGEILALSTKPDYDPNAPPRSDLELLQALVKNRVVSDAYEPGSTFKIITLSSALDSGALTLSREFDCPGYREVNGERIKCWRSGGHGHQTLAQAVKNSCNPAFMSMGLSMGKDVFYDYIYRYGFGSSTESGLTGESGGIVIHQKYIRDNNIARISFGQSIAVTPIQLASAVSAAINGGELMQPYIVKQIVGEDGTVIKQTTPTVLRRVIKEETSAQVRELLEAVVKEGSGRNAQVPGYRVGGKTGTAQKYVDGKVSSGSLIASFIGFAPADDPKYLVLILVDEPQVGVIFGSTVAAPFVKDVLQDTLMHYGIKPSEDVESVIVPDLAGKTAKAAEQELRELGLIANYLEEEKLEEVVRQTPAAGSMALTGSGVLLYTVKTAVDSEPQNVDIFVTVPDLSGKTRLECYEALAKLGLELVIEQTGQRGTAIRQKPEAGEKIPFGEIVKVEFSTVG